MRKRSPRRSRSLRASIPRRPEHPQQESRGGPAAPGEPAARRGRACARLPCWLVEGARNQREDSLAALPGAAGHDQPAERGNSAVSCKHGFASGCGWGGRQVGRRRAASVTAAGREEAS